MPEITDAGRLYLLNVEQIVRKEALIRRYLRAFESWLQANTTEMLGGSVCIGSEHTAFMHDSLKLELGTLDGVSRLLIVSKDGGVTPLVDADARVQAAAVHSCEALLRQMGNLEHTELDDAIRVAKQLPGTEQV